MKDLSRDANVSLLKAVLLVIAGLILLINPGGSLLTAVKVFGAAVLAYGIFTGVSQLLARDERQPGALAASAIAVVVGVVVLCAPRFVVSFFSVVAGIVVVIGGGKRLWDAIAAKNAGVRGWGFLMLLAVVCILLGILIIVDPFGASMSCVKLTGIVAIYYGVTALIRLLRK